jgi:hypothetical protein
VIDIESQNISLFDVTEQLTLASDFFTGHTQRNLPIDLEVVSLWTRVRPEQPLRGKARLRFLSPGESMIHQQEFELDLTQAPRTRSRLRINALPLQGPGQYNFALDVFNGTWLECARVPLEIKTES